ncbi:hypothetical protein Tco_0945567 [Tanacetum coccineum]
MNALYLLIGGITYAENTTHDHEEREHEEEQEDEERCELIDDTDQEPPIFKIRRTNEDAYNAYKEIFRNMDEGRLVTRAEMKKKSNLKT